MNYPITPEGVADLLSDLYMLSDADLKVKANAVKANWTKFVIDNFILDNAQKTYLGKLPEKAQTELGDLCWSYFLDRQPITFVYVQMASADGKFIETKSTSKLVTDNNGTSTMTGSLEIAVRYRNAA